jgi:hypothetical protein
MFHRIVQYADKAMVTMHFLLCMLVMVVWLFAWRVEPAPMGPPFNFAKRFISRVDILVSRPLDAISMSLATRTAKWFGTDLGLTFTVLFGILILLAGTLQWFLVGRFVRWTALKYGQRTAILLTIGLGCCIGLAFITWAMSW